MRDPDAEGRDHRRNDPAERPPIEMLCGIVGLDVGRSLSPRVHNAAYRALAVPARYLPFSEPSFETFWSSVALPVRCQRLGLPLRGLTVVAPFKEAALQAAGGRLPGAAGTVAEVAGAANLLVRDAAGTWRAGTTDGTGVLDLLRSHGIDPRGRRLAVVGCGGTGRAAAVALRAAGAKVCLVNRGVERGRAAADRLGLSFRALARFDPRGFAVVVNAIPAAAGGRPPFPVERLDPAALVIDHAYGERPTPLAAAVQARGLRLADGLDVLLAQSRRQLRAMVGIEPPLTELRRLLAAAAPAGGW